MSQDGLDAQLRIYGGADPHAELPILVEEWRRLAEATLPPGPWGYLEGAAGAEDTMLANRRAFERWRIRPRFCRDVENRRMDVSLWGQTWHAPFLLAPIGVQSILHPEAELASARAAAQLGMPYVLSTVSSVPMERIAEEMGDAIRWFQLYPGRDPEIVRSFIRRAEAAGYSALVVTVDTTMLGWREQDLRHAYLPFLEGHGIANFLTDPVFRRGLSQPIDDHMLEAIQKFLSVYVNPRFSWEDLAALRRDTRLPLIVKGLSHPDDVRRATDVGADGIIISNHGGRQVDGAVAALDALDDVMRVAPPTVPILMDSGIRHAADVFKALALGAKAVLVGRPYGYGLAVAGQTGVERVMAHLRAEFDLEMALSGCASIADITRDAVMRRD